MHRAVKTINDSLDDNVAQFASRTFRHVIANHTHCKIRQKTQITASTCIYTAVQIKNCRVRYTIQLTRDEDDSLVTSYVSHHQDHVSAAVQWTPGGGKRKRGRPKKTWQDTLRDDLQAMGVDWEEAKSVAGDRREWRSHVAQCSSGNRRT